MNLEAFQRQASRAAAKPLEITVLYLPQLLGLALGLSRQSLGLGYNLALTDQFKKKIAR